MPLPGPQLLMVFEKQGWFWYMETVATRWMILNWRISIEFNNQMILMLSLQMEDGHSLFDYSVGLNDIVQLLVRQSPAVLPAVSKEKDSELSDTDSGCGSGQSESDKSSHNGEGAMDLEGQSSTAAQADWADPGFGLYKVSQRRPNVA